MNLHHTKRTLIKKLQSIKKRTLSGFLLLTILFNLMAFLPGAEARIVYAASTTDYDEGVTEFGSHVYDPEIPGMDEAFTKLQSDLPVLPSLGKPLREITVAGHKEPLGFNFTLWYAKQIIVYGEASMPGVNPRGEKDGTTDWKAESKYPEGKEYYSNLGRRGEYRYHGYTYDGKKYSNTDFPPDTPTKIINSYAWLYQPWGKPHNKEGGEPSKWNGSALKADIDDKDGKVRVPGDSDYEDWVAKQVNRTRIAKMYKDENDPKTGASITKLDFSNRSMGKGNSVIPTSKAPHDYANVMSMPSLNYPGEARLWTQSNATGAYYYRTTFIEPSKKADTKIQLTAAVLNPNELLGIKDFGSGNTAEYLNSTIEAKVKLTATLKDEAYLNDITKISAFKIRSDLASGSGAWTLSLTGATENNKKVARAANKGEAQLTVKIKKSDIINMVKNHETSIKKEAKAIATFQDGTTNTESGIVEIKFNAVVEAEPSTPVDSISPDVNLPDPAFDIVPYSCSDNTSFVDGEGNPVNIVQKRVYVDGTPVDYDTFFSGSYVFGDNGTNQDRLSNIRVEYVAEDGSDSHITRWIRVLNTKPRIQYSISSNYKVNRKFSATNTSTSANTPEVIAAYPITNYTWTIESLDGNDAFIRTGTGTDALREFTFKKVGTYKLTLVGTNTLGRTSDPYTVEFEIQEDTPAAMICELNNVSVSRGEALGAWFFESVSTDGDAIDNTKVELYHDADNDGTPETLINTWENVQNDNFPAYTPDKLGLFRWKITSKEKMMGDMIPAHVTPEDATVKVIERDFWCDNYIPQTGLYVNIPIVRPLIDTLFLLDANLDAAKVDYIKNGRMDFNNFLRSQNILPIVENWDMHTYVYSQPASTSSNTGTSYPPETVEYSSEGYTGTLNRTSVSDNGKNVDKGSYQTRTETTRETYTISGTTVDRRPPSGYYMLKTWDPTPRGDLYCTAYYYRYTTTTVTYWVSNWQWVANYTGYYSGTIYKSVRQPYLDPFRATSNKYVVYVSDGNIAELNDLQDVIKKSGAKLILIGQDTIKAQISYDYFILNNKPISDVIQEALYYISGESPASEQLNVLAGVDTFTMNTDDFDQEADPIIAQEYQYVQDADYFDNPQGMEAHAQEEYDENTGWTTSKITQFNKTGKYTIYRRIKDNPSNDPNFAAYSYYSGTPTLIVYAHRTPIASATLDWDFDTDKAMYNTTWVDHSYDLDHQFNRPDKGIVERKIMFRQSGGEWNYTIPSQISPGTYELQYFVKDPEGVWSKPYSMNFTLSPAPPMQFNASLRAENSKFSTGSIPASESLEVYNAWTRYPYNVYLTMGLYNQGGTTQVVATKTVNYSATTGTKVDSDINWNNIQYQIPEAVADGIYTFRITAMGEYAQSKTIDFPVTVNTPINLKGYINDHSVNAEIYSEDTATFRCTTSIYVNKISLLFKGESYKSELGEIALIGNDGITKTWEMVKFIPEGAMGEGERGNAEFTASLPGGGNESCIVDYKVIHLKLTNLRITKVSDYNWKSLFVKADGTPTHLQTKGIGVEDMPLFQTKNHKPIKLGYKIYFELDTIGLNKLGDSISVHVEFYVPDGRSNFSPVDIFVEEGSGFSLLRDSSLHNILEDFSLSQNKRFSYEQDPSKAAYNTWKFDYFLPATIKVVKKGQELDLFRDNSLKTDLLVVFQIIGRKETSPVTFDYTKKEIHWGSEAGLPYGYNKPSGQALSGSGVNAGEVFWYDLNETLLDDIEMERGW